MEELQEAVRVPYTTVKLQNDITFGEAEGQGVTISEDGIILDLNGYTLTSKEKGISEYCWIVFIPPWTNFLTQTTIDTLFYIYMRIIKPFLV